MIDKKVYIYISSINDFTRYEEAVGRIADHVEDYENGIWHIGDNPPKKKVTPKEGEWWLVEREGCKSVLRFSEFGEWQHEEFAVKVPYSVKPICKMIEEK